MEDFNEIRYRREDSISQASSLFISMRQNNTFFFETIIKQKLTENHNIIATTL